MLFLMREECTVFDKLLTDWIELEMASKCYWFGFFLLVGHVYFFFNLDITF